MFIPRREEMTTYLRFVVFMMDRVLFVDRLLSTSLFHEKRSRDQQLSPQFFVVVPPPRGSSSGPV